MREVDGLKNVDEEFMGALTARAVGDRRSAPAELQRVEGAAALRRGETLIH